MASDGVQVNKKILTVVMVNAYRSYIAAVYEEQSFPYSRRTVQIELTDEQMKLLEPRECGNISGEKRQMLEEIERCWLEDKE